MFLFIGPEIHGYFFAGQSFAGTCPVCLYFTLAKRSVNEREFALYTSANDGQVFLFQAVRVTHKLRWLERLLRVSERITGE